MKDGRVLIVGAGIAGPTLAYWLHAAGFRATLLERAPAPRTGGYVIDFWGLGYDVAERMGLRPAVERAGYHAQEMRIVDDRGARAAGFGVGVFRELTGGRYVSLRRSDLARLLLEALPPDTETLFGDEVTALADRGDAVDVRLRHGGERRFDLVVGADGLHSSVRGLTFGPEATFERSLGYLVAAFETRGYRPREENVYVAHSVPGQQLARFALHDDRTLFLLVAAVDAATLSPMPEPAAQKALLHRLLSDGRWENARILNELDRAEDLYFDRVAQIVMPTWSRGRVALLGDAAFCVSLMAGQGSALAMTAAYVLAGELGRAGGDHAAAFAAYETLLRPWIATKQRGAARFAGAFAPRTRWGLALRNLVIRAFAIPGAARLVIGRDIADTLTLPDYGFAKAAVTQH
ncbi:MAG: FAD-binding domain [Alphaproteobacteria bacterium]|nr:FAD-binding domain [Alphaproteobacteria bacterium]